MAEEMDVKSYTSKLKIGGTVYYLKDDDARSLIAKLNGADTIEGSVLHSIKTYGAKAAYGESNIETALSNAEGLISKLNGDKTVDGSVKFQIYHDAKDSIYSITPAVTREATPEDVSAGLATEVGEVIVVTPAKVVTIQEAIEGAANSIGGLTVNGLSPDENMAIELDASNIKRAGSETDTIESTLSQAELDIDAVEGRLNVLEGDASKEGSVLKTVKDNAKDATYTEAVEAVGEEGKEGYVPAKPRVTIAQAISNLESKVGEDTAALRRDINANTDAIEVLNGDVGTTGSVSNTVYNKAGDATFKFTGAETATTIKAAIQANADAIEAVNNGKITVVEALPSAGEDCAKTIYLVPKTTSVENGGKGAVEGTPGYIEWVCLGDVDGNHNWEEIGDTDIDLTDYVTKEYLIENAKDANYKLVEGYWIANDGYLFLNRSNGYDVIREEEAPDGVKTLPGSTWPRDTEIANARYVDSTTITIKDALDELFSKVAEGTASIRADLDAEIVRATGAEEALDVRVTANEDNIETLNGGVEVVGSVSNSIREQAKAANYKTSEIYTKATNDDINSKDLYALRDGAYVLISNSGTEDPISYEQKEDGTIVITGTNEAVYVKTTKGLTIAEGIDANATAISNEVVRAKGAEDALTTAVTGLDERVDELEAKVTGTTVKSVNGVEATVENGGAVVITSSDIEQTAATETIYYTEDDPEVISGKKQVGDVKVAGKSAVTVHDAIVDSQNRVSKIEKATLTQTINGVNSTVAGNFSDGISIETVIDAKNIKMDKSVEGSVTLFDKINNMLGSTAQAITSVNVKEGTGTWLVDADDKEMLEWKDITLETSDATFLVPSAE